ncbi:DUF2274 domain-containing protein [Inquilinus sp. Marseille-Q2685]|uniref:DUF2274 domain-containing protein n=1 Tax=Inquilinus sp. Marseille-Q2685 TaxID=2866581 RepID=UPI001CE4B47A|nr:DUF2274 domain-containing protein [Inquilinus sp. Marseille-Q2685]
MPDLKLRRLPDRTPARISFQAAPELAQSLRAYADLYRETYGRAESVSDLVPYMLESFLASDRAFVQARKAGRFGVEAGPVGAASHSGEGRHRADLFAPSPEKED